MYSRFLNPRAQTGGKSPFESPFLGFSCPARDLRVVSKPEPAPPRAYVSQSLRMARRGNVVEKPYNRGHPGRRTLGSDVAECILTLVQEDQERGDLRDHECRK
ncbi:MAG: hypothetical protein AAGE80_06665 [Pseudomonadota bacterium]